MRVPGEKAGAVRRASAGPEPEGGGWTTRGSLGQRYWAALSKDRAARRAGEAGSGARPCRDRPGRPDAHPAVLGGSGHSDQLCSVQSPESSDPRDLQTQLSNMSPTKGAQGSRGPRGPGVGRTGNEPRMLWGTREPGSLRADKGGAGRIQAST